jgi:hypothetical protein
VRALAACRFALRLNVLATRMSIPDFLASEDGVPVFCRTMRVWPERFADAAALLAVCGAVVGWGNSTSKADCGEGGGRAVVRCRPFSGE